MESSNPFAAWWQFPMLRAWLRAQALAENGIEYPYDHPED
jgi:hypothetical protein